MITKWLLNSLLVVVIVGLLGSMFVGYKYIYPPKKPIPETQELLLQGVTDADMMDKTRVAIKEALDQKVKKLKITLISNGGPVFTSIEIARLIRNASDKNGLIVEIHAQAVCASGCTLILASGTPGYRYIDKLTLFLIHPPQQGGGFTPPTCVEWPKEIKTVEDKINRTVLILMRDAYMRFTKMEKAHVTSIITCGNESVGNGELAVKMGLADKVE